MKKLSLLVSVIFVCLLLGLIAPSAKAQKWSGTYVINGIKVQVSASHKNQNGQFADGDAINTKSLADIYYAKAYHSSNKTFSYSNVATCGNTTAYTIKILSCTATNKCSDDGSTLTSRSTACKTTTTTCPCGGCTNGACKVCPDDEPVDILEEPIEEPVEDPVFDILTCTEDVWECGDWSSCNVDTRSRSCLMLFNCPNANTPSPAPLTESCVPGEVTVPNCPYPAADGSCPPPTISFTANPKIISKGGSCNLNWKVSNADACEINNVSVSPTSSGSKSTGPLQVPKVYKMTCTNGPAASASEVQLCSVQDVIEY